MSGTAGLFGLTASSGAALDAAPGSGAAETEGIFPHGKARAQAHGYFPHGRARVL